jgi:mitofilin
MFSSFRYCIDRDDFLQALRYLNLLTGCSRAVAKEWMKEATVFLETNQAIDLILSHSTVSSYSTARST